MRYLASLLLSLVSMTISAQARDIARVKNPPANCLIAVTSVRKDGKTFKKTYRVSEVSKQRCAQAGERHREIHSPRVKRKVVNSRWLASEDS